MLFFSLLILLCIAKMNTCTPFNLQGFVAQSCPYRLLNISLELEGISYHRATPEVPPGQDIRNEMILLWGKESPQ